MNADLSLCRWGMSATHAKDDAIDSYGAELLAADVAYTHVYGNAMAGKTTQVR